MRAPGEWARRPPRRTAHRTTWPTPAGAPTRRARARRQGMGDSPDPAIDQQGPTRAADTTSRPSQLIERAETAERIAIEGGRSRFPPRPVLPVGRPRLGARPSSGVRLRYGRLAPVGAARRGAAPLLLVSSSYRYRCAVLATRLSRQLHSALVAQPRRQRCAARCCVISPLLDGVPSAPSRRRLHAPLVTSPSREQFVLRDADRGCTHVLVWRTGFPHAQFAVPGTARRSSIPGSWIRGACVVAGRGSAPRPDRTGGGSPPTSRGAKHPRLVRGSGVIQVRFRGSRAPLRGVGASRRRCAGGAVPVAADRSRVAGSRRSRSGDGSRSGPCTGGARC